MPDMGECAGFWQMCNVEAVYTSFPLLCSGKLPDGEPGIALCTRFKCTVHSLLP
jgi:hypothetical protein